MRKHLLLTTVLMCFVFTMSNAQFAVRAGVNMANIALSESDEEVELSNKVGFHFGLMAEFAINDNLSFRPGLLYSQRGTKIDVLGIDVKTNVNYLDIPLSFTYAFQGREKGFFIEVGPNIQYLLSANVTAEGESEDVKEDFKSIDFGLLIGAGYKINQNISLGVNYNLGLANIAEGADDDESAKNRNIGIYAAYAF